MDHTFLIMTSIAKSDHPVLRQFAKESAAHNVPFIVVGDTKSPKEFNLAGCDFYSIERQQSQDWALAKVLPLKHYARKNLGYLVAMAQGAEVIIETDDDNIPLPGFWGNRSKEVNAHVLSNNGWINVYKYFTEKHIWPRGFALEHIQDNVPLLEDKIYVYCPIQQGLANENPDVDAIYRFTLPLPQHFENCPNVAIGKNTWCPFNSQNTSWFKEVFPLLYLPSYCSFRMTDIWRSFVAQRILWTLDASLLFHNATVYQKRNDHDLLRDFRDEIPGYLNNEKICKVLEDLDLKHGSWNIYNNLITCYKKLVDIGLLGAGELELVYAWVEDLNMFL